MLLLLRGEHGGSGSLCPLGEHVIVCKDLDRAVKTVGSTTNPRYLQVSHFTLAVPLRGPQRKCVSSGVPPTELILLPWACGAGSVASERA